MVRAGVDRLVGADRSELEARRVYLIVVQQVAQHRLVEGAGDRGPRLRGVPAPGLTHGARLAAIGRRPAAHEETPGQIGSISLQAAGAG